MKEHAMTRETLLAGIAGDLNATPETAGRVQRHDGAVFANNARLREAADRLLTLDASPLSFQALKLVHLPPWEPRT
jgi:hypothetical protein